MNDILNVKVTPGADDVSVEQLSKNEYRISLTEPASEGRANEQLIAVLAAYFDYPEDRFQIVHGHRDRSKYIKIHN